MHERKELHSVGECSHGGSDIIGPLAEPAIYRHGLSPYRPQLIERIDGLDRHRATGLAQYNGDRRS